jgi:hypothetical protein
MNWLSTWGSSTHDGIKPEEVLANPGCLIRKNEKRLFYL